MDDALAETINAVSGKKKIQDRMSMIERLEFDCVVNKTFADNLKLLDSYLDKILGMMILLYYGCRKKNCAELATLIEDEDPFKVGVPNFYRYKIKKFLSAVALGLMLAKEWNGIDEASGGYLVVTECGELVILPLTNRDDFETYLLNSTRLETPDSSRHNFAKIYSGGGRCEVH